MNRTFILFLLLLGFINIFLAIIYYQGKYQGKQVFPVIKTQTDDLGSIESSKITPSPTRGPTPTSLPQPIPHGKQEFTVSTSTDPQMRNGFVDPFDPKIGEKQTISITAMNKNPIDIVRIKVKTDHQSKEYPMKLVEGTVTDGRWEGTWEVKDTYLYIYEVVLEAESGNDQSSATIISR